MSRWWLAGLLLLACGDDSLPPQGQVLLYFDTDAPVPTLFDTLSVDVFKPGEVAPCPRCTRSFALRESFFHDSRGVSIGIPIPAHQPGWIVRARLYDADSTLTAEPPEPIDGVTPQSVIDVYASLPSIEATGIVERSLVLHVADVGDPQGSLDAPVATLAGRVTHTLVGTWEGAHTIPCTGNAGPDEVCVPGGAFWMGNPRMVGGLAASASASDLLGDSTARRLVVLSPFFMKRTEVTVAEARSFPAVFPEIVPWSGGSSGNNVTDYCTFTSAPTSNEEMPLNCITRQGAIAFCKQWGGELPTEAQFEYVAGNLKSQLFPWGSSSNVTCDDVSYGRYGYGRYNGAPACMPPVSPGGARSVGLAGKDRVPLKGGVVVDLAANVSEFVVDDWNQQSESCWNAPGVFVDPVCHGVGRDGQAWSVRGGAWTSPLTDVAAARRQAVRLASRAFPQVGFRCVRTAQ